MAEERNENTLSSWVVSVPHNSGTGAATPAVYERVEAPVQFSCCEFVCQGLVFILLMTAFSVFVILPIIQLLGTRHLNLGIHSLSVSVLNFSTSSQQLTAYWEVGLLVRNPNTFRNSYHDDFKLSVWYNNQLLSQSSFPGFYLYAHETKIYTHISAAFAKRLDDSRVADAFARDLSQGVVAFTFKMEEKPVRVICADIEVGFANNQSNSFGTMISENYQQAFGRCCTA